MPRTAASLADRAALELLQAERTGNAPRIAPGFSAERTADAMESPAQVAAAERALSLAS